MMDSTARPISSPSSTVFNSANELSSKPSCENTNSQNQLVHMCNKVVCDIQQSTYLFLDNCLNESKMSVMFGVEYMSQGTLKGASLEKSLKIARKQLEKLCRDNPQNIEFTRALDEITFAWNIEQAKSDIFKTTTNKHCAKKIVEKIALLQKGEGILLPACHATKSGGHAMMARIVCTHASFPKTYIFSIYNEGQGLSFHNRSTSNLINSKRSWENVSENKLTQGFFTNFLNHGIRDKDHSIEMFYDLLNSTFRQASNETPDAKNLTTSQRGGSCSAQCILSALRDILSQTEYQALKSQLRHHYLYKIYTRITLGDPNPLLPLITLELIHKIEKNQHKTGSFSKFSDLDQVKQEMEKKIIQQSHLKSKNQKNPQKQIAAFFKGNSDIVSEMSPDTLTIVIQGIQTTPCTKKQFEAIQERASALNIHVDSIKERFTRSKGNIQFQNIISDENAITKLDANKMLDLLRRISSQEITCKYSEYYNIQAQAKELGIQIPDELEKRFPKLTSIEMITEFKTDNALANYMDFETVVRAKTIYPGSIRLHLQYIRLMVDTYKTDPTIASRMDLDTVEAAIEKYRDSQGIPIPLLERYKELTKSDDK